MSTTIRTALASSSWLRGQDLMGKRLSLLAIRLLVSVNLLYAAIFLKFAGCGFCCPVHADVASSPWVGISTSIPARVRSLRDSGCDSAPDPEDSQIGRGIDCWMDECRNPQSHFRVGIWLVLCRCSHVDGARCNLCFADTRALPLGRTRKRGDDGRLRDAPKIVRRTVGSGGTRSCYSALSVGSHCRWWPFSFDTSRDRRM